VAEGSGHAVSRRAILRAGALGAAALAAGRLALPLEAEAGVTQLPPLAPGRYSLNQGWLFGGVYATGAEAPGYSENGFGPVVLPHTVTPLSWGNWDPSSWEKLWIYRRHIDQASVAGGRVFVDFAAVMTTATVWLNGIELATHQGGYLPFSVELTDGLVAGDNVLAVRVDATLQDVPPSNPAGDAAIDYLQPGGIVRDVALRIVPDVYIADVYAEPVNVLTAPGLEVGVSLDPAISEPAVAVTATLMDGATVLASATVQVAVSAGQPAQATLSLGVGAGISLWSPESPKLYTVQVTAAAGKSTHQSSVRTGFREAVFDTEGFHLNGELYEIFGVDRHGLFPYTGMSAPQRVQRADAAMLKNVLRCNMVRCSHYPQSDWFLDACDELGLMVWQEPPGWQYVGDAAFRQLVIDNVHDMVLRDRSRPSVIVWATRLNETSVSATNQALYTQTGQVAQSLDTTRQTTGAMDIYSTTGWNQQVFAFDDYSPADPSGNATLQDPLPGVPYMVSEAVGAIVGAPTYRWVDPQATLAQQAQLHAQVHDIALSQAGNAGLLGWAGIDYQSLNGGTRLWNGLKTPGVTDTFRVPKPAAGFYGSQVDPSIEVVIAPAFFWDFGSASPANGPGAGATVYTNCDRLDFYVGDATTPTVSGTPNTIDFPHLAHPPVVVDLPSIDGSTSPDLRIDGFVGGQQAGTLILSSDTTRDALTVTLDDTAIAADGSDATRFTLRLVDAHGNHRPVAAGDARTVTLSLSGPGALIADNPFPLGAYGGVGGGFIRSEAGAAAAIALSATLSGGTPLTASATLTSTAVAATPQASAAPAGSGGLPLLTGPPTPFLSTPRLPVSGRIPAPHRPRTPAPTKAAVRDDLRRILSPSGLKGRIGRLLRQGYTFHFRAPSKGRLVVGWYREAVVRTSDGRHERRSLLVASASADIARAGRATIHVRLNARGRSLLRHATHERLTAEATFTPHDQRPVTQQRVITLRR
jgi:beta-galactosidase